jgi:hypothetical protein
MVKYVTIVVVLLLPWVASGCVPLSQPTGSTVTPVQTSPPVAPTCPARTREAITPLPTVTTRASAPAADATAEVTGVAHLAVQDLADRLGVPPSEVQVVDVEEADWPDTSLGCPEPGTMYAQVITPGYELVLACRDRRFVYHSDMEERIVFCGEAEMPNEKASASEEAGMAPLIEVAVNDLASRLSVARDAVTLLEARSVVWPDTSLGCPAPGMRYLQVPRDGALIRLGVGAEVYAYHSGGSRGPFLCEDTGQSKPTAANLDLNAGGGAANK